MRAFIFGWLIGSAALYLYASTYGWYFYNQDCNVVQNKSWTGLVVACVKEVKHDWHAP